MRAAHSVMDSALHAQRMVSRHDLENDLRAWYLRACRERIDPDKRRGFERQREARRWFKALYSNQHFERVLVAFRREQEPLSQAIALVSWLKDAQQTVDKQLLPYKGVGRLSTLDKIDTDGGLRGPLLPELDKRLPHRIFKRSTTLAGLFDFLGLPITGHEVAGALRRHARASVSPAKPAGAVEITRLLRSWAAPHRET